MKPSKALLTYTIKRVLSDKTALVLAFAMPIGFYILMAAMFTSYGDLGINFTQAMIPNFLLIILSNALFNIFGLLLVETYSTGNMEKYQLLGISRFKFASYLMVATLLLITVISIAFMGFVFFYSGQSPFPSQLIASLVAFLLIALLQFALMIMLTGLFPKTSSYGNVAMIVFMFQMFTGGLTFPVAMFPETLRNILLIVNPMAHASVLLQNVWIHGQTLASQTQGILFMMMLTIVFLAVGAFINRQSFKAQTIKPN